MLLRWQSLHYTSLNLGLCRILTPQFRSRLVSDLVLDRRMVYAQLLIMVCKKCEKVCLSVSLSLLSPTVNPVSIEAIKFGCS